MGTHSEAIVELLKIEHWKLTQQLNIVTESEKLLLPIFKTVNENVGIFAQAETMRSLKLGEKLFNEKQRLAKLIETIEIQIGKMLLANEEDKQVQVKV